MNDLPLILFTSLATFIAVFLLIYNGWPFAADFIRRQENRYDLLLNRKLLMNISPRIAILAAGTTNIALGLIFYFIGNSWIWFIIGAAIAVVIPHLVITHIEQKRKTKLDEQLIGGIASLTSGTRAGLNLIGAMQLLTANQPDPIRQEFQHMLREYDLGIDLAQAMRNAADRIGLSNYRLLFAAIEAHRQRGGDMAESLDRISDSIREIQRLEGKLNTLTAQGRAQARMMAIMPLVLLAMMYLFVAPKQTEMLFTEPIGRLILLVAAGLITAGFIWIKKIMSVDI